MPIKLSPHFRRLYNSRLFGDDALNAALAVTISALEKGEGVAELAPVPGLASLLQVLAGILKKVQATTSNTEALRGLQDQVKLVHAAVSGVARNVHERIAVLPVGTPDRVGVTAKLNTDKESTLATRIIQLEKSLQDVLSDADRLATKSRLARFFQSDQMTDAISNMTAQIDQACRNFQLQGGIAIEVVARDTLRAVMDEADARILKDLSPVDGAPYRSDDNAPKSRFLQGTREEVFRNLDLWVEQTSVVGAKHRVLVLIGAAGMGKSTVASEFCRRLSDQNRLGASFFFTRGTQGLNSIRGFFDTIAYQLATLQPDRMHDVIVAAARKHLVKGGSSQNMRDACEDLVRAPLRNIPMSASDSPIFIVVDALDECTAEHVDTIPEFLSLLLSCTKDTSSPLRILLTSRPDSEHVRNVLTSKSHPFVSVRQFRDMGDRHTIDHDIEAVIRDRLSTHDTTLAWFTGDETIIQRLVEASEGIFVYAATAVEFLRKGNLSEHSLNERLGRLLSPDRHITLPHLDNLYLTVLETAFPADSMYEELLARVQLVLGGIAMYQTGYVPSLMILAAILGISPEDVLSILRPIEAVVEITDDAEDFHIIHTTFRDFLLDPEKTKALPRPEFHVDAAQAHATLALGCMRLALYYVEKYMPELLEESSEMLERRKLRFMDLGVRLNQKLRGKKVDEPEHSVDTLYFYVRNYCAYHRELSTSVRSAEMIDTAKRFDQIATNVFNVFCVAIYAPDVVFQHRVL
ncbi:hypothetical protein C8Q76DRAFT_824886 [Earliella scabrosa]|nr:hypothetical protein C8Q76DRAFT_824886 [Earliella scabrosa]